MKTITLQIADDIWPELVKQRNFRRELRGCVSEQCLAESLWYDILAAIEEGKAEVTIVEKGKP
jgi:hypothetical protein